MTTRHRLRILVTLLAATAIPACEQSSLDPQADGVHMHGDAANGHGHAHADAEPVTVTLFTPKLELFMEYPQLLLGEKAEFLAHLTVLATGEPVRSGSLTFEVTDVDGQVQRSMLDAPRRDGLFVPEWTFESAGPYRLRISIDGPQVQGRIDVGELIVHADEHRAAHAAEDAAEDEPANMVPFLMEQQWKIGMLSQPASRRTLTHRLALPGEIAARYGASAVASPPIAGRLLPPEGAGFPHIGERVEAGQVLAFVEPPLPMTAAVQLRANRAQVEALRVELGLRRLDLRIKALEVKQSVLQSQARLEYARRANDRVSRLREKGVGTEQQYDEAERNLRLAQAERDTALTMKQSYDTLREELNTLTADTIGGSENDSRGASPLRMPIRAPISGVVVHADPVEGEHVEEHEEVFRIIDADPLWVTAKVSEFDLSRLPKAPGAILTFSADPEKTIDILEEGGRLVHIGTVVDPDSRTVPIRYELPNPTGRFRVGQFVDVHVETRVAKDVVAIPDEAIVMDNGRPFAYVLIDGETFERRELKLGVRDGGFTEVSAGVTAGERVVTRGAYAVKLSALSPASFGHGHAH